MVESRRGPLRAGFLHPPFKPCVRFSRTRLTGGREPGRAWDDAGVGRTLDDGRVETRVECRVCASASSRLPLGTRIESVSEFSCFCRRVVGPRGHALALTSSIGRDQSRAPSLRRSCGLRHRRYYEPLGLPPATPPFRHRLIGDAFARRGPAGRASPVPCRAFAACRSPYPGSVLSPSGPGVRRFAARGYSDGSRPWRDSLLPSPRHDRLGHLSLSGFHVTRLQEFIFVFGPHLCSPDIPKDARAFDAPLKLRNLFRLPEPATWRTGAYHGGTRTRWFGTACWTPVQESSFRTRHGGIIPG